MEQENERNKPAKASGPTRPEAPPPPAYEPLDGNNPILEGLNRAFPGACLEGLDFIGQWIFRIEPESLVDVCRWLRDDQSFDMLADVTAVDFPDREKRFTVIYNLYSVKTGQRILLHVELEDGQDVNTVSSIWLSANWPEREVFDMFGVAFEGHPDLRRILMPDDWTGHPLRKEYDLKGRDAQWMERHLGLKEETETPEKDNDHE